MRKTLIAAAAIAATSFSTLALAQAVGIAEGAPTSVTIDLSGKLEQRCKIETSAANVALDLEITTVQTGGDLSVTCNYSGSPDVKLVSANLGKLKNTTTGVELLGYSFVVDSAPLDLAGPKTVEFTTLVSAAELTPSTKSFGVQLIDTAVIAGDYSDTVTASVTPN